MARGWESKSVEQQQEEAKSGQAQKSNPLTPEQIAGRQRRTALELSRNRVLQQLDVASNARHRQMLEAALAELERQIGQVE